MIREINITAVLNGYVVKVGCQSVVFNDISTLLTELDAYLRYPDETEKRYSKLPNANHTLGGAAVPTPEYRFNRAEAPIDRDMTRRA